jgi:exopolysaccharide biosynthesis polyprenyl glycosylphosphotransferase
LVAALLVLDAGAIFLSFLAVGLVYLSDIEIARGEAMLIVPLFMLFGLHGGLYRSDLILAPKRAALKVLYIMTISAAVLIILSFYAKTTASFSRVILTFGCSISVAALVAIRGLFAAWVKRFVGQTLQNTLILHAGGDAIHMDHAYQIDIADHQITADANDPANLDRIGRYIENMDRVIVNCPPEARDIWAPLLRAAGVEGEFVSADLRRLGALNIRNEPGFTGIVVSAQPLSTEARVMKRVMDVIVSTIGLLALAPLMLVVALAIRAEDGGPVLFRQRRMGSGNRFFWIYKFRSMRKEAADSDARRLTSRDDDRTTRIGKIIRRTSIDELPQLVNVLKGDMSLVGPRPHALGALAGERLYWEVDSQYWKRHALRPGLTGLAQVRGFRGNTVCEQNLTDRLQADLEYIANWTFWLDVKILIRTVGVVIHDNAY